MKTSDVFCLDPSCFTSLNRWKDTLEVLEELQTIHSSITVYLSSELYYTIMLQPEEKFSQLLITLEEWLSPRQKHVMREFDNVQKDEYVETTRKFISKYNPKKASILVEGVKKIGTESIHLEDVIAIFGVTTGQMLFEIMALSASQTTAKIISFGKRTSSLISRLGTPIISARSDFKHKIKDKKKIRSALGFMIFVMSTDSVHKFMQNYQIQNLPLTIQEIGTAGLLFIADGFGV